MKLTIILGNQLFPKKYYSKSRLIFMSEDFSLCTHFKYHKHKLIFFLASMRNYRDELKSEDKNIHYYELKKGRDFFKNLKETIANNKVKEIEVFEIEDKFFESEIQSFCKKEEIDLQIKKSPMFLVSRENFKEYNKNVKKPFMKSFYESLRKTTGILMDGDSPTGGKYSFDSENRKKIPKNYDVIKNSISLKKDPNVIDVCKIVETYFPTHPGESDNFWMHTSRSGALKELNNFFKNKFEVFGDFEDAIDSRDPFLYHSILSPYINIGFLTPEEVIKKALEQDVSLNSKEGFVRQILGWREFVRGVYQEYSEQQEHSNFFNHKKKLNSDWYEASTGLLPLDDAINKTVRFGYNHHIERLMIISNLMLLCEINPQEVYRWFMEMYVDSSDWVMGPNVFGMAQFSDGGIFATKPYICGSNYILKMSHYKKDDWCEVMDGLYWRFIDKHKDFFSSNYRMSMMVKMLEKMDDEKKKRIFKKANTFIKKVTI